MAKKIVFCKCNSERINSERLKELENKLRKFNIEICVLSDLCQLSVLCKDNLRDVFQAGNEYLIIGCYERSLKLLLNQIIVDHNSISIGYINTFELTDDEVIQRVSSFSENSNQPQSINAIGIKSDWPSWFPVIDYSRCSGCGQCADFCLFGVYEKTEGSVIVVNPQDCKNNCPACARICPQTAIVFPKYKEGGAIGGSDEIDEVSEQTRQIADIRNFLEGDIYSALEQRKIKRRSIIRQEEMKKALDERQNALNKG
jgi:ferredoxin